MTSQVVYQTFNQLSQLFFRHSREFFYYYFTIIPTPHESKITDGSLLYWFVHGLMALSLSASNCNTKNPSNTRGRDWEKVDKEKKYELLAGRGHRIPLPQGFLGGSWMSQCCLGSNTWNTWSFSERDDLWHEGGCASVVRGRCSPPCKRNCRLNDRRSGSQS